MQPAFAELKDSTELAGLYADKINWFPENGS